MNWLVATSAFAAPTTPGTHELVHEVAGVAVPFTVVLPALPTRGRVPVVLALHYGGEGGPHTATDFVRQLVEPGLRQLGAVVVAPDCPGASWTEPVSQRAALAVLDHALSTWPTDPMRVVLVGFSMGGIGAWPLADAEPERFAAVVPIAGHPGEAAATIRVPVYAIHGVRDEVVPYAPTQAAIATLRERGVPAVWMGRSDLTHYAVAAYVPVLQDAVPWLLHVLEGRRGRRGRDD